jgi:hypothetical protein
MSDVQPLPLPSFKPERVPVRADVCGACRSAPRDLEPVCLTCGAQLMAPNVAIASRPVEQDALVERVERALAGRSAASAGNVLAFGEAVRQSRAVVNVSVRQAMDFVEKDSVLYATYAELVRAGARRPAPDGDDARRRSVEAMLFGSYAEEMRYGALSLGGPGLVSYGAVTLVLHDVAVARRASVLEENSFTFVERHKLRPGQAIPAGYRSAWPTRHQVAMAKSASSIDETTTESQHASLLMTPGHDRNADEFIEVFIFGPFGPGAIERLVVPARPSHEAKASEIRMLRSKARRRGIAVEEA